MFARTKRLTLRPGWPEDAPALAAAIGYRSVVAKLSRVPWPYGIDDAAMFLSLSRAADEPRFLIESMEGDTPRIVGGIGISADEGATDTSNLGYWLTPDVWGRGYATEAGQAVIAMARHALGMKRLTAAHFVDNPASGRVLAKLGFRATGRIEPRPSRGRGGATPAALLELDLDEDRHAPMPMAA